MGIILNVDGIEDNVNINNEIIKEVLGQNIGVIVLDDALLLFNKIPGILPILNNYTTMFLSQNRIERKPNDTCFLGTSIICFPEEIDLDQIRQVK